MWEKTILFLCPQKNFSAFRFKPIRLKQGAGFFVVEVHAGAFQNPHGGIVDHFKFGTGKGLHPVHYLSVVLILACFCYGGG